MHEQKIARKMGAGSEPEGRAGGKGKIEGEHEAKIKISKQVCFMQFFILIL